MNDTIGCYDRDCVCNQKPYEPCVKCEDGYLYGFWRSECCFATPEGEVTAIDKQHATGRCSKCGDGSEFLRERTACKCQTTFRGE